MAKNFIADGQTVEFTNGGSPITSGTPVKIGDLLGVSIGDVAASAVGVANIRGVWSIAKASADTIAQGVKVYWSTSNSNITTTSAGNTLVGRAYRAAGPGVTSVEVFLTQGS